MEFAKSFNLFGVEGKEIPCITGKGVPTVVTKGAVGCLYMDENTGYIYKCTAVANGVHTWTSDEKTIKETLVERGTSIDELEAALAIERARITNLATLGEGSTTGDAELADIRLGTGGCLWDNAGNAIREQMHFTHLTARVYDELNRTGKVVLQGSDLLFYNTATQSGGVAKNDDNARRLFNKMLIEIPAGAVWKVEYDSTLFIVVAYVYDNSGVFVSSITNNYLIGEKAHQQLVLPTTKTRYVRFYVQNVTDTEITCDDFEGNFKVTITRDTVYGKDFIECQRNGKNLFNPASCEYGYVSDMGLVVNPESNYNTYVTTAHIPMSVGEKMCFSVGCRKIGVYDLTGRFISLVNLTSTVTNTYTAERDCLVRVSVGVNNIDTFQMEKGDTQTDYEPYTAQFPENIHMSETMKKDVVDALDGVGNNVLSGKKYVACGDSFTAGDFSNDPSGDTTISGGLYDGYKKVYPYIIGNRNNMTVVNEAIGGSTLAYTNDRADAFSTSRYKNIPADADYITIKFGINDGHKSVPIGSIDDTDNTTFYGAWNIVLEYLLTNYPYAKLGVIVSNGLDSVDYAAATITVCKKWGIPYLDMATGTDIPLMLRSLRTDVTDAAKSLRNNHFSVLWGTNNHPNGKAHEFEATIVENWLRSI